MKLMYLFQEIFARYLTYLTDTRSKVDWIGSTYYSVRI